MVLNQEQAGNLTLMESYTKANGKKAKKVVMEKYTIMVNSNSKVYFKKA